MARSKVALSSRCVMSTCLPSAALGGSPTSDLDSPAFRDALVHGIFDSARAREARVARARAKDITLVFLLVLRAWQAARASVDLEVHE